MDKILKRDDFIKEIYTPMMEQKKYDELVSVNEGLLKTLFGMAKNLFKKDWETIKGDPEVIRVYKEIDEKLREIGGKRAYVINLLSDGDVPPVSTVGGHIMEITRLIDKNGNIDINALKMLAGEGL